MIIFKETILNIIYPKVCYICGSSKDSYLCKKCENKLKQYAVNGKDIYVDKYFEIHYYIFKYDEVVRKLILNYKFREKAYLYRSFMQFFSNNYIDKIDFENYDIIMPVPISKTRMKNRGYNQSLLIAKEISILKDIKLKEKILIKQKNNNVQSNLNKEERLENVKNVYKIQNEKIIENKKILVVDDIFTTGSTVNECARILKEFGAKKIDILTIAKD